MSNENPIFVIETNDFARKQLAALLPRFGLSERVQIVENAPDGADSTVIGLSAPYRVGVTIDRIFAALDMPDQKGMIDIGGGRLIDRHLSLYYADKDAQAIRLTEKEAALLLLLAEAQGETITREQLLDDVWKYVEGVETHTLETHIYRLRQKIEDDPGAPKILKTSDSGYYLSVESLG